MTISLETAAWLVCHCRILGGARLAAMTNAPDSDKARQFVAQEYAAIAGVLGPLGLNVDAVTGRAPPVGDVALLVHLSTVVGALNFYESLCGPGSTAQQNTAAAVTKAARQAEHHMRALGLDADAVLDRARTLTAESKRAILKERTCLKS